MDREEILNKAGEAVAQKNFGEAKQLLEDYIKEINDTDIEVEKTLGLCNVNLDNYAEAKENFEKVVEVNDDDATSWFYLGMIYEGLNDIEKAQKAYEKVIVLREDYKDAYKNLAIVHLKLKNHDTALEFASKALVIDNTDYQIHYIMGTAYTAKKNTKKPLHPCLKASS